MPSESDIRFHNILPNQEIIDRASETTTKESPQLAMVKTIIELVSTADGRTRFGDPESGSTLEQVWRLRFSSAGVRLVCLVVAGREGLTTSALPTVARMDAEELVDTLAQLLISNPNRTLQPFVFDGRRGYAMTLLGYDPDTTLFRVNEPNPTKSRIGTRQSADGSWTLSAKRLAESVCATLVDPTVWADLNGVSYQISYSALKDGELWSFFGVRESRRQNIGNGQTIVFLEPGGFKRENRLHVKLDGKEHVRSAVLLQARAWMMSQSIVNPFALDLAKGFVKELTPEPDDTSELVAGLWALKSTDELTKLNIAPSSNIGLFLQAYLGTQTEAWLLRDFVKLQVKTIKHDELEFMQLQMDHS